MKLMKNKKAQMSPGMKILIVIVVAVGLIIAGFGIWKVVRTMLVP